MSAPDARPRWRPGFIAAGLAGVGDIKRELSNLGDYLELPALDGVQFAVQAVPAPRPREGLVMFFAAGVVGAGAGLYQFKAGAWAAL